MDGSIEVGLPTLYSAELFGRFGRFADVRLTFELNFDLR
jgi:hypothetical protein